MYPQIIYKQKYYLIVVEIFVYVCINHSLYELKSSPFYFKLAEK